MNNKSHPNLPRSGLSFPGTRSPSRPTGAASELMAMFGRAVALHQAGQLEEAEALYQEVLRSQPRHFDSMHLLGVIQCQRGELHEAVRSIDTALKVNPNVAAAHNNRGNALKALGRAQDAIDSYGRAIALKADYAEAFYNRANVFRELGRFADAIGDYDRAIALRPIYAEALNNRGNALKALGRFEEALAAFDRAVALRPDYAEAWYNRSNALHELRRFEEEVETCDKAIALKPDLAEAFNNRGNALRELRRFDEAIASYSAAVAIKANFADAYNNLGNVLKDLRRFDEALASYDKAIALRPDHADAIFNGGIALGELQRPEGALACYDRALALKPEHPEAYFNRGTALLALKRFEEAIASYGRAIALKPDLDYVKGLHIEARMKVCDWTDWEVDCSELIAATDRGFAATYPFQLLACDSTPATQLAGARTYVASKCPTHPEPLWRGERYAHERIRIAYLSADLREHPVSYLAAGLFAGHDRSRFETIAVSFGADEPSAMRDRLKGSFERFLDVDTMSDREVAHLMRQMEIDIAVDLNGFTDGARPNILARRPAPVQVNYLGYAGTLGQDYCDYIVADRFVIPEESRIHYAEKVAYLPDCFMVNDAGRAVSPRTPSRAEAGLPDKGMVFCCFNNTFKITPPIFDVWMRLLDAVEGSVLWLSPANDIVPKNLRREAEKRGVSADRLVFASRVPLNEDHLARVRLADLFLDTLYYNAHATTADALWAGVPVVTCAGATFAGRVAGSLLHAVGLPELVTVSLAEYEALALQLASDPARLTALRKKLALNRDTYPLFDTDRFTRHLEAAYTAMWERAQRGEPPMSFAVPHANGGLR